MSGTDSLTSIREEIAEYVKWQDLILLKLKMRYVLVELLAWHLGSLFTKDGYFSYMAYYSGASC